MRSSTLLQAYERTRFLRKVMLGLFCLMFGATVVWAMPWVPWGLTHDDYSAGAGLPVALALGAWLSAFGAVYLRDQSNRYEQALVTWSSVRDELGDLRRREYFYERVVIECARSEHTQLPFGVFAVRLGHENDEAETTVALDALSGLVRQTDTLAALGFQEVGVLAVAMGAQEAPAFARKLSGTLEAELTSSDRIGVGWATWGVDAKEAGTIVGIARQRMQRHTVDLTSTSDATGDITRKNESDAA